MKKFFLSLVVVFLATGGSFAQTPLIATLSHGSNISTYNGENALVEAYADAVDGDIITLSSGTFKSVTPIEKALTIRGAGMMNLESDISPTFISGYMTLAIPTDNEGQFVMEGISRPKEMSSSGIKISTISKKAPVFLRSSLTTLELQALTDVIISQCYITEELYINIHSNANIHHINIDNSAVKVIYPNGYKQNPNSSNTLFTIRNSVIGFQTRTQYATITNSIITGTTNGWDATKEPAPASNNIHNCICTDEDNTTFFSNILVENNNQYATNSDIFRDITTDYRLTDAAASLYKGDDGTQVGIYGGVAPFNPTPTNPQISKFTVVSTKDGDNLSVKINVE